MKTNPFLDLEIPHELIQERAGVLYKQRNKIFNDYLDDWFDDLANWFEAERQIRQEIGNKELQTTSSNFFIISGIH
jgi:hypothetical protein